MHRAVAILLTVMLALASFAGTAHAMPHGHASHHAMDDGASGMPAHVGVSVETATSCCLGEVQRTGPSCAMFVAVLPSDHTAAGPDFRTVAFTTTMAVSDGLGPNQLFDPPRS